MTHPFLSAEWFRAVEQLRAEAPPPPAGVDGPTINVIVVEGPTDRFEGHLEGGVLRLGHADGAKTTVTMPYDVAKSLIVGMDPQAAMGAFTAGKIKVDGDMTTLMSLATRITPTPEVLAFAAKLQGITA